MWKDPIDKLPRAILAMHGFSLVDDISTCFEGTRTNVLDFIKAWINIDESECVFWLNGMAGIGKTTFPGRFH